MTGKMEGDPITIVGAGPAGLACAIVLARAGRTVIVREWHRTVGARSHSDFQGLENWSDRQDILDELRSAGVEADFEHHPIHEGTAFDAWGQAYPIRGERPLYYLVRRGGDGRSLDFGLLKQAIATGAEVRFDDRVTDLRGPTVLAIGPRTADAIAAGYVFQTDCPDGSWIAFNNALAPLGYSYLLIHGGDGTVATCMFTGFKRQAEHVERTVAFFSNHAGLTMRNPRPFGGFANFRLPRTAVQGGHLVIGEQAGFQDALAGFGMRYALRSGIIAAQSLIEGTDYTKLWRKKLLPLLRTGTCNRFIFNTVGERGWRWALRGLSRSDTADKLRRLYHPSALTRLLYPLACWRYRTPLGDPSCDHADCDCVWCRTCAGEERFARALTWSADGDRNKKNADISRSGKGGAAMLTRTMLISASVLALAVSDLAAQTVDSETVQALRQMAIEAGQTSSSAAKPPARSQEAIEADSKSIERHSADFLARVSSAKAYVGGEGKQAVSGTAQLILSPPAPPSPTVDRKTVEALRQMAIAAGQTSSSAVKPLARSQEAIESERQSIERHRANFFSRVYEGVPQG